jgi:hypothetical protein
VILHTKGPLRKGCHLPSVPAWINVAASSWPTEGGLFGLCRLRNVAVGKDDEIFKGANPIWKGPNIRQGRLDSFTHRAK